MRRRLVLIALLAFVLVVPTGCFRFTKGDTFGVWAGTTPWMAPEGDVTLLRKTSRRLFQLYDNDLKLPNGVRVKCSQSSWKTRIQCVRGTLRDMESKLPNNSFVRDRWRGATVDNAENLSDMNSALSDARPSSRCYTVYMRIGPGGDIGYNWTYRSMGTRVCSWGNDPTPGFLPAL